MFNELSLYIGHEIEYRHSEKKKGKCFIRPVPGKRGGARRKLCPVQKLAMGLIWNTKFLVWGIAGSKRETGISLFCAGKGRLSLSDHRNRN